MSSLRDLLNEIKWTGDLSEAEIWFIHRGAANDTKILSGSAIKTITSWSIETSSATIPFHRIFKVIYKDKIVFQRT